MGNDTLRAILRAANTGHPGHRKATTHLALPTLLTRDGRAMATTGHIEQATKDDTVGDIEELSRSSSGCRGKTAPRGDVRAFYGRRPRVARDGERIQPR